MKGRTHGFGTGERGQALWQTVGAASSLAALWSWPGGPRGAKRRGQNDPDAHAGDPDGPDRGHHSVEWTGDPDRWRQAAPEARLSAAGVRRLPGVFGAAVLALPGGH